MTNINRSTVKIILNDSKLDMRKLHLFVWREENFYGCVIIIIWDTWQFQHTVYTDVHKLQHHCLQYIPIASTATIGKRALSIRRFTLYTYIQQVVLKEKFFCIICSWLLRKKRRRSSSSNMKTLQVLNIF